MIEVTANYVDGVEFLGDIKILAPDDTIAGVGVHRISFKLEQTETDLMRALKALGLRKVGIDLSYRASLYSQSGLLFTWIKITQLSFRVYWFVIRQLYSNARIFQEIPRGTRFSWSYFTPYVWYKKIRSN